MIFSGVIKPTAVVINRGHSLPRRANASRNSSLSHVLANDSRCLETGMVGADGSEASLDKPPSSERERPRFCFVLRAAFEAKCIIGKKTKTKHQNSIHQPLAFFENEGA